MSKFYLLVLIAIGLVCVAYRYATPANRGDYLSEAEELVVAIQCKTIRVLEKRYGLKCAGEGVAMPEREVQKLALYFDVQPLREKAELRKLLIDCAHELMDQVNQNEPIRQYLVQYPFTVKNVEIVFFSRDLRGGHVYAPGISTSAIREGRLIYCTVDANDIYQYKEIFEESYEEALSLVYQNHQHS